MKQNRQPCRSNVCCTRAPACSRVFTRGAGVAEELAARPDPMSGRAHSRARRPCRRPRDRPRSASGSRSEARRAGRARGRLLPSAIAQARCGAEHRSAWPCVKSSTQCRSSRLSGVSSGASLSARKDHVGPCPIKKSVALPAATGSDTHQDRRSPSRRRQPATIGRDGGVEEVLLQTRGGARRRGRAEEVERRRLDRWHRYSGS
jgi:hypothetical protein